MPISVQLIGRWFDEDLLLAAGLAIEVALSGPPVAG
jgi:Asp-tRNA(Asn)/Glu-tRNA(Gln) amidotransferase A subunit family amidase